MMPDRTADRHSRRTAMGASAPSVTSTIAAATASISPISITPPTIMNSPMKKKSVGHSTSRRTSCGLLARHAASGPAAPVSATSPARSRAGRAAGTDKRQAADHERAARAGRGRRSSRARRARTARRAVAGSMSEMVAEEPSGALRGRGPGSGGQRSHVEQEGHEVQVGGAADQEVRRVTDQVEAPPMLEARISATMNGKGLTPRRAARKRVIGPTSTTVVTLSRKAEATAVMRVEDHKDPIGVAAREARRADRQPAKDARSSG